jgi:hypothetical protein
LFRPEPGCHRIDAKDGVLCGDRLELGDRRSVRDREVVASAGGDLAVRLENGRSLVGRDFHEHDRPRPAPLDERLAAGGAGVLDPLRTVTEH